MSVETKEVVTLENGESGRAVGVLLDSGVSGVPAKSITQVKITCDYSGCQEGIYTGLNEESEPVRVRGKRVIEFVDNEDLPPEVWGILTLGFWDNTRKIFCCGKCLDRWKSDSFVPLKAPGKVIPFPVKEG